MRKSPRPQPQHRQPSPGELPPSDDRSQPITPEPANPPPTRRRGRLTSCILLTTGLIAITALGYIGYNMRQGTPIIPKTNLTITPSQPKLGAGTPLENDTTNIQVLTPPSAATITVLSPSTAITPTIVHAQPYDDIPLRLGLTLTLLQQAITTGQPATKSLAETATKLSQTLSETDLTQALTLLTQNLPATGPITQAALLTEISRLEILGAPLPVEPASGPARPSPSTVSDTAPVWRKLVGQLVTVKPIVSTTNPQAEAWLTAMTSAHQALALNRPTEALFIFGQPPLNSDTRLHTLISLTHDYATAQQQLTTILQTYNTRYLLPATTETTP